MIETSKPVWAAEMKTLLPGIKAEVDKAQQCGRKGLPPCRRKDFLRKYDEAIEQAKNLYGALKRKRGRVKKPVVVESPIRAAARKLACRLSDKRDEILLFMNDFSVPFANNQAECDLRILKVEQKISRCFRTEKGAEEFCRPRSYVSTMRKQGRGVMETIKSVMAGKILMPQIS